MYLQGNPNVHTQPTERVSALLHILFIISSGKLGSTVEEKADSNQTLAVDNEN